MRRVESFYSTYLQSVTGQIKLNVVQNYRAIEKSHKLLAVRFNGLFTTWSLVCSREDYKTLEQKGQWNFDFLLKKIVEGLPVKPRCCDVMEVG